MAFLLAELGTRCGPSPVPGAMLRSCLAPYGHEAVSGLRSHHQSTSMASGACEQHSVRLLCPTQCICRRRAREAMQ